MKLNVQRLNLNLLRVFDALMQEQNLSRAALLPICITRLPLVQVRLIRHRQQRQAPRLQWLRGGDQHDCQWGAQ